MLASFYPCGLLRFVPHVSSLAAWSAYVFAASAQTDFRLAGTTIRRQRGRAGVGWVAFVEARLRLNGLRDRIRHVPDRSAGPERGCFA
jgi:hypothetical protein